MEHVWSSAANKEPLQTKFVLELYGVLVEMGWGGWKMIALPTLLKRSVALLDGDALGTLRLLAKVKEEGKLGDVDLVWKRGLETWLVKALQSWDETSTELVSNSLFYSNASDIFVRHRKFDMRSSFRPIFPQIYPLLSPSLSTRRSHRNCLTVRMTL